MIFIFGYSPKTSNLGPVEERECTNCHNTRHWLLRKQTYWISLFFIPVIPTKTRYHQECPVCHFAEELSSEEYSGKKDLAELNQEAVHGDMSEEDYQNRLKQLRG